jgi:tetratricopeptide (TPR) repeat protein
MENAGFWDWESEFLRTDPFNFIAGVLGEQKTMESSFQIARTISFNGMRSGSRYRQLSMIEYQIAIGMARQQGSESMVRRILLGQISAFVQIRIMRSDEQAQRYIEEYIALDQSNALVHASLGVVRYQEGDYSGAIEAFQNSLDMEDDLETMEYSRSLVAIALLRTMFASKDFHGMMAQIKRFESSIGVSWIRESLDHAGFQRSLMYAGRKSGKTELLLECFQQGIDDSSLFQKGLQAMKNLNSAAVARLRLDLRSRNTATRSMFRCYLAWLHQECLGKYEEAINLWTIAFFQHPEFLKIGKIQRSAVLGHQIIPDMFGRFSQLLYDRAIRPNGGADDSIVAILERLRQREEAFHNLEADPFHLSDQQNMQQLLARLYWRSGRKEEARKLLDEQFQRVVATLVEDIGWGYNYGCQLLSRALFTNEQPAKAEMAASLTRFFKDGYNLGGDYTDNKDFVRRLPDCAGWCTFIDGFEFMYDSIIYACTTCANVVFCEGCYQILHNPETAEEGKIYVCNSKHEFLKSPAEGLEKIENGMITMNGKEQTVEDWLDEVKKEWKMGLYFRDI